MASVVHQGVAKLDGLTRSDFWFADGNIILVAGHAAFKVHRGQLERHSDIFRDLFTIPQPQCQDMVDGCPWVELHDSPADVLHLLSALYDGLYFTTPSAENFAAIAGVMRLSTKYMIDHLRERCLTRLQVDWPSTLAGWDKREKQATDSTGRYAPRENYPHPILVIHLAHELQLEDLLPAAFYDLSRYGPRKIVSGAMTWQPLSSQQTTSTSSKEPVRVTLSNQELYIALLGRETGQRYLAVFIEKEISLRKISANCSNKSTDDGRFCRESFYFIMLNVLRSVGGIACGRDADPLFTLIQALEMLSRTDFSDGTRQCGLKICAACKADFSQSVTKTRQDIWREIPAWFKLQQHKSA